MLVQAHLQQAKATAAGPAIPVEAASSFAATQAAWRFWANEDVTPAALVEPLRQFAREQIVPGTKYVLSVIDWSKLDYKKHSAKTDVVRLTHQHDIGYELTTQLIVCAETGRPIAPIQQHLKTADGYLTTADTPVPDEHRLEQITPPMDEAETMQLGAELMYVIDREADSVWHFRQWNAAGRLFVVRGDDRRVTWQDGSQDGVIKRELVSVTVFLAVAGEGVEVVTGFQVDDAVLRVRPIDANLAENAAVNASHDALGPALGKQFASVLMHADAGIHGLYGHFANSISWWLDRNSFALAWYTSAGSSMKTFRSIMIFLRGELLLFLYSAR